MEKVLRCGDLMAGCQHVVRGATDEEVLRQAAQHAAEAHGMTGEAGPTPAVILGVGSLCGIAGRGSPVEPRRTIPPILTFREPSHPAGDTTYIYVPSFNKSRTSTHLAVRQNVDGCAVVFRRRMPEPASLGRSHGLAAERGTRFPDRQ